jgi:hypothetical protein
LTVAIQDTSLRVCSLNVGAVCEVRMVADVCALSRGVGNAKSHSNSFFEGPPAHDTTINLVKYVIPQ